MPEKSILSFAFAIPKFHVAEKQEKNHYQCFLSLILIAPGKNLTIANLVSFHSQINKLPTQPLSLGGQLVIKKKKEKL